MAAGTGYESRFGLTGTEWRVLAAVTAADGPTQAEVVAVTGMDKMSVSRAVAALAARRLVDRVRDGGDRRTLRLTATAEGRHIHDEVAPAALRVEAELLATLAPDEAVALRRALARLRQACEER